MTSTAPSASGSSAASASQAWEAPETNARPDARKAWHFGTMKYGGQGGPTVAVPQQVAGVLGLSLTKIVGDEGVEGGAGSDLPDGRRGVLLRLALP